MRLILSLLFLNLLAGSLLLPCATQAEDLKYYDVYLTDNRVCKKCAWRVIDAYHVELVSSKTGRRGIYSPEEIIGVDKHPFWRRVIKKSIQGSGYAGQIIAPDAFDRPDLPTSAHP